MALEAPTENNGATPEVQPKKALINFNGDILGIGKFLGHLGLGKLPVAMRYCIAMNVLVTMLMGLMLAIGVKVGGFPAPKDFRYCMLMFFIIFFCGFWMYVKEKTR